ncbi:MAG: hypothetical protein ACREVV_07700 [Steroidobacteraceae bacterium]
MLGGIGFVAGYFGPIALDPDANQGPLLGIFVTGPGGAVAGLILGAIFRVLPVSNTLRSRVLWFACATWGAWTLYRCLPEPAVRGYVIDATVEDCVPPTEMLDAAVTDWEHAVARVTWAQPPAHWKETAIRNVEDDPGVVLTMHIQRRSAILEHRRPWNRGRKTASPWVAVSESKRYYAPDAGSSCEPYLARGRELYFPVIDPDSSPNEPAKTWPPTEAADFLDLQALGPVPPQYQRLLDRGVQHPIPAR